MGNFKEQLDAALIRDGRVDMRVRFDYCTPDQIEKIFESFYPQCKGEVYGGIELVADPNVDPDIAALEAKLTALRAAKELAKTSTDAKGTNTLITGSAFRDALLLSLGEHQVSAAQLQHVFVTHRKCTPAEAIADVGAIVASIQERAKEEADNEVKKPKEKASAPNSVLEKAVETQEVGSAAGKTVHIPVHPN